MNVSKHLDIMLASTALLVSGANFVYFQKRITDLQKDIDELSDSMDKHGEETVKTTTQSTELQTAINGMNTKLQSIISRVADTEEDGIVAQEEFENHAIAINTWSRQLIEELKTVKADIRVEPVAATEGDQSGPQTRARGVQRGAAAHTHNHGHTHTRRRPREQNADDDLEDRFRSRRRT